MTGWTVIAILIISSAVLGGLGIIAYGTWSILTDKTFLLYLRDIFKGE